MMLSQKAFIDKLMKWNQSWLEVARLLAHLACENKTFSKQVAKRALVGLNKASADECSMYTCILVN